MYISRLDFFVGMGALFLFLILPSAFELVVALIEEKKGKRRE